MKKLFSVFLIALLATAGLLAQPVQDNALIPVSVTLNSILRLNVVSGGNIEFNFNTMQDYQTGFDGNLTRHQTNITVASSQNWDIYIGAEDANLINVDDETGASFIGLDVIGIGVDDPGAFKIGTELDSYYDALGSDAAAAEWNPLIAYGTVDPDNLLLGNLGGNAGDVASNSFLIKWCCASVANGQTAMLDNGYDPGRYTTNVVLTLMVD